MAVAEREPVLAPLAADPIEATGNEPWTRERGVRPAWLRYSALISVVLGVALWWLFVGVMRLPAFVLPAPDAVLERAVEYIPSGRLWGHLATTLLEALLGGSLGVAFGLLSGYALARSEVAERLVSPYLVASQSVPIIAFTPVLILWFGTGLVSKVIICAIIVFFPMTISAMVGLRSVDPVLHELMRTFEANRWQTLIMIEIPAALPSIFGGLKLSGTLSILGAVVGEFVGSKAGLGYLVNYSAFQLDTPLMFVGLICLVVVGVLIFSAISAVERRALRWRRRGLTQP
ncbi:MAG: ABC transporter permease [Chloroflexi bacterium]|nr:ABC transporter permease [Chloroflexota bacterium]